MNNGTTGKSGPQFSNAHLITSAALVGAGTFFILRHSGGQRFVTSSPEEGVPARVALIG